MLADWRRYQSLLAFPQALPELEGDSEVVEVNDPWLETLLESPRLVEEEALVERPR